MNLLPFNPAQAQEVTQLFKQVFSASEGEAEGQAVSQFVDQLIHTSPSEDLYGFIACSGDSSDTESSDGKILGCIFFSRMRITSGQNVFILSPVAISSDSQGQGIGQQLIQHGLAELQGSGVEYVFTYGDPSYYSRFGFELINESQVKAPFTLSHPEGWLALAFEGNAINNLSGNCQCVEALNVPALW